MIPIISQKPKILIFATDTPRYPLSRFLMTQIHNYSQLKVILFFVIYHFFTSRYQEGA